MGIQWCGPGTMDDGAGMSCVISWWVERRVVLFVMVSEGGETSCDAIRCVVRCEEMLS